MKTAGWFLSHPEPVGWGSNFYRLGPGVTVCHIGAAFVWLCLCWVGVPMIRKSQLFILLMSLLLGDGHGRKGHADAV